MRKIILTLFLPLFVGCAHTPARERTDLKPGDFLSDQRKRESLTQLEGSLRMAYRGKESVSGKGKFWVDKDNLRLELKDPLGRTQYVVVLSGKNFTAHYPRAKVAYVDSEKGAKYVEEFLGMPVPFTDLLEVMLGRVPSKREPELKGWEWTGEFFESDVVGKKTKISVDPDLATLRRLEWEREAGELSVKYEDFDDCCEKSAKSQVKLGHLVEIGFGETGNQLEMEWIEVGPLKSSSAALFEIDLPSDVKKVVLK